MAAERVERSSNRDALIIDSFAGGGGASTGIEMALGRSPDVAINHDPAALAMHAANHPATLHLTENVWKVDPRAVTRGRLVFLLWASPDCRHHSKAKGGKPVSRSVRGLADVVILWAQTVRPQIICLENVEEFRDWGPLDDGGRPCPVQKGADFTRWARALEREGYAVEWRELRACDYGAPTIRKRLFVVARRDGHPILWPDPTHGDPKKRGDEIAAGALKPWRTAAEIIDWSLPCPSIFLTREDAKSRGLQVVRPLAAKTMSRIARGFKRYVLDRADPFIVGLAHGDSGGRRAYGLDEPHRTVTGSGSEHALVAPHLMTMRNSGKPYTGCNEPTHTVTAGGAGLSVVEGALAPFVSYAQHGGASRSTDVPIHTICANAKDQNQIVCAYLAPQQSQSSGASLDDPLGTVLAQGNHHSIVLPHLTVYYGMGDGQPCDAPLRTATTLDRFGNVEAAALAPPLSDAQMARARQVAEFLRAEAVWDANPDGSRDIVIVRGCAVIDIGMRMLTPRELARAQGFPDSYILAAPFEGGVLTETAQRHKIGNSVCPDVAAALVRANAIDALARPRLTRRPRAKLPIIALRPTPAPAGLFGEARACRAGEGGA